VTNIVLDLSVYLLRKKGTGFCMKPSQVMIRKNFREKEYQKMLK